MKQTVKACFAELIGTFGLVLIGPGAAAADVYTGGQIGIVGIGFAHGLALMAMIFATGHISGGHINPAVTIGMILTRKIGIGKGALYIVFQLVGAIIAGFILKAIFLETAAGEMLGTTVLGEGMGFGRGVLIEAALTFLLVFTIFGLAVDRRAPAGFAAIGIGLVLAFDIIMGGAMTGASMNPARTFGPALASNTWSAHGVYWLGPIVGSIVASVIYNWGLLEKREST